MSEHGDATNGNGGARLAAHERLATGSLARWARACATHPWRTILGWVALYHRRAGGPRRHRRAGSLKDEFDIPGSDTQKATDLIESRVHLRAGGRAQRRLRGSGGRAPGHAGAEGGDRGGRGEGSRTEKFAAHVGHANRVDGKAAAHEDVKDPFDPATVSKDGRIAYAEAQFDQTIEDKDRDDGVGVKVEDFFRNAVAPVGVTVEYNGDAEFPPLEQGTSELLGPAGGDPSCC